MELELKTAVPDRESYEKLLRSLGDPDEVLRQVNYYFDTKDEFLRSRRTSVRVRSENNRFVLTMKRGTQKSQGYFQSEEIEDPLDMDRFDPETFDIYAFDGRVGRILTEEYGRPALLCLGNVSNRRLVYKIDKGLKIEVDETHFPGNRTEFEIECESEDETRARKIVGEIVAKAGISVQPQTLTKHQRFLKYSK